MPNKQLNILIIGDRFMTAQLFKDALESSSAKSSLIFTYDTVESAWPDEPLRNIEEVREAAGNVDALMSRLANVHAIVTDYGAVTKRMIEAAPSLQLIAVARGGPVSVNTAVAEQRGISVVHLPGRNSRAVAEFTLGMILCQLKKIAECHADMRRGIWRGDLYRFDSAPRELPGQVVGLIGFGAVSKHLTPLLIALSMRVVAFDPWVEPRTIQEHGATPVDFDCLLTQSDVVSLHARSGPENAAMMGDGQFRRMKTSAHFINTARGELVDYTSLCRALKEGWIAGAALDIYENEPMREHDPLLSFGNVTMTSHIAGSSRETALRSADMLARDVVKFFENRANG